MKRGTLERLRADADGSYLQRLYVFRYFHRDHRRVFLGRPLVPLPSRYGMGCCCLCGDYCEAAGHTCDRDFVARWRFMGIRVAVYAVTGKRLTWSMLQDTTYVLACVRRFRALSREDRHQAARECPV